MATSVTLYLDELRSAIQDEYTEVASCPWKGSHFHTGRFLTDRLGYPAGRVESLPDPVVESLAGVGNSLLLGRPRPWVNGWLIWALALALTRFWRRGWSVRMAG